MEGNTVRWRFVDFEPKRGRPHKSQHLWNTELRLGDHDIELCSLSPDVQPILADLRAKLAADPHNPRRMLDLAKHLLALSDPGATYPMMTRAELPGTSTGKCWRCWNRKIVRASNLYARRSNGSSYRQKDENWTQDADELTTVLYPG